MRRDRCATNLLRVSIAVLILAVPCPQTLSAPPEVVADWKTQDGLSAATSYRASLERIVDGLGAAAGVLRDSAERIRRDATADGDPRWADLYLQACERRRELHLRLHRGTFQRLVFTKHYDLGGSHYAYTEGQSDAQNERHFEPGAKLCLFTLDGLYGRVETLLEDAGGVIRDPDVSYDGRHILFAWKKSLNEDDYHLYEMNLANGQIRQLTFGLGFADYEGAYLPNGDLIFNSTRCVQTVDCWWTEVSNLFTCDPNGRFLRRLCFDQVHSNYPTLTPDGRVIYTRWDYSDRGQIFPQGLFQMHPDGTAQTEFYGNNSWFPTSILHARGIPGSQKVVAIFSGHHCLQKGCLGILNPAAGRQENQGAQLIAPIRPTDAVRVDAYGQEGDQFQYPYPLSDTEFIVAFKPAGSEAPFALYWMDQDGHRELLAVDPKISCNQPIPLSARPVPHQLPSLVDYHLENGLFYVQDIYAGPGLAGIPRGTIKNLRIVALRYRAAGVGYNNNHGPAGDALVSTPISIQGAWDVKVVLGTAKVYEDGSACFNVPARTPVYFQALDAKNHAVQSMRSWAQLQPGETFSCVGCHESKNSVPVAGQVTEAMRAGPQLLTPWYGPPRGFGFEREIQPILDRHCVACHYVADPSRLVDLSGPASPPPPTTKEAADEVANKPSAPAPPPAVIKPAFSLKGAPGTWSPAYRSLANRRVSDWINIQGAPEMLPPYAAGAAKSRLIALLEAGHEGIQLSTEEMDRIACWIDLLVPCFGDYTEGLRGEDLERYQRFLQKRKRWEEEEKKNIEALLRSQQH